MGLPHLELRSPRLPPQGIQDIKALKWFSLERSHVTFIIVLVRSDMALPECKAPGNGQEKVDSCGPNEHSCPSAWSSEGGSEGGEGRGTTDREGYVCPFPRPGALAGQAGVPKPLATAQSHPSPGGCASRIHLSPLVLHFTNSFCERQAGPRGAVSLCPCPWEAEKEKGRRRRRSSGRDRPGCGKQLAEKGKLHCVRVFGS